MSEPTAKQTLDVPAQDMDVYVPPGTPEEPDSMVGDSEFDQGEEPED